MTDRAAVKLLSRSSACITCGCPFRIQAAKSDLYTDSSFALPNRRCREDEDQVVRHRHRLTLQWTHLRVALEPDGERLHEFLNASPSASAARDLPPSRAQSPMTWHDVTPMADARTSRLEIEPRPGRIVVRLHTTGWPRPTNGNPGDHRHFRGNSGLQAFDHGGVGLAAAFAHGLEADLAAGVLRGGGAGASSGRRPTHPTDGRARSRRRAG